MGVDRSAAGAAPIFSVGTAYHTIKIKRQNIKKMSQKRDEIYVKKHPRMNELAPFF